ncbi:glycosyltransferase [candidate division GN15 bacterium]|nr:glycosyltransferase [candidate division GN15 bacterium]
MTKPVRLLLLTHNYPRRRDDYAGVFIALLAHRLSSLNIKPIVVAPHDADLPEREDDGDVRIYRFRYARNQERETLAYRGNMHEQVLGSPLGPLRFYRFLKAFETTARRVVEREQVDLIAGHWLVPSGMIMKRLARSVSLPMILSSHGTDIRLLARLGKQGPRYFRPLSRRLHRWTVVSSFLRDQLLELGAADQSILEVLPLPHNEKVFYRDSQITRQDNLIVAVTRFTSQKRVDVLIRAFHWVVREDHSARLELYGSGPLEAELRELISELGLERQVIIHEPISQQRLREVYNRAAVVVLNSYREGFGLALSEAMLCGAPVIGAASGGITDIIEHEKRGLLVELDNVNQLAEAILRLLKNKTFRDRLAEHGYRFARATYASGPLAGRYADIICAALTTSNA